MSPTTVRRFGFARQSGQSTVAGVLEEALGRIAGEPVTLTCAGRTDAGVHAEGQVVWMGEFAGGQLPQLGLGVTGEITHGLVDL